MQSLATIGAEDWAGLLRTKVMAAVAAGLIGGAVATAVIVVEYRLMIFALLALTPCLVGILDFVSTRRARRSVGSGALCADGDVLVLPNGKRLSPKQLRRASLQPHSVVLHEGPGPRPYGHLLPLARGTEQPLVDWLRGREVALQREKATLATVGAFLFGVMGSLVLGLCGAACIVVAVAKGATGLYEGTGAWAALPYLGGGVAALFLKALIVVLLGRAQPSPSSSH